MKNVKSIAAIALSTMLMILGITSYAEGEIQDYSDYVPQDIPENFITSYNVVNCVNHVSNGVTSVYTDNNTSLTLKCAEGNKIDSAKWNMLGGTVMSAKLSVARADGSDARIPLNLDFFKAAKTYVFKTKVKKVEVDTSETGNGTTNEIPVFGLATNQGYKIKIYPNEFKSTGKQITSTEYEDYAVTMTFPSNWSETDTTYEVGQNIFIGMLSNSTVPSSLKYTITPGIDTFYLAEEVAYDITVEGEKTSLNCNETIDLTAEINNQVGIKGTLLQNFKWYVVNEERTELEDGISVAEGREGFATVSVSEDTEYGTYYVIAESEDYAGFKKGFKIEVKKPPLKDYIPGEATDGAENHIQKPENISFATASSNNVTVFEGDGYAIIEAMNDIESELGAEGLKVRTVGSNGLPSSFNFEPGKNYVIKAKVRNPQPETDVYFNASISNSTADTLALTTKYGEKGMLLTEEWQEFKSNIMISDNYDANAPVNKRVLILGFNNGTPKGAKAEIELSVSVEDVSVYDIFLKVDENIVLGVNDSFEAEASVVNTVGGTDGILQEFNWYLLDNEKVNKTEALKIEVSDDTKKAKVITDIYSEADTYYLVCESKNYDGFVKSIRFEVDKPTAEEYIKEFIKTADKKELEENLEEYMKVLDVQTDIENINYENLSEIIVGSRSELNDENMNEFLKKAIVISAYENVEGLYNSDGSFKYDAELNLKELDKNGVTVYSLFTDEISKTGKIKLQKALEGTYTNFEEFEIKFAEEVILKSIENPKKSGLGILELILTKENAEFAQINIDEYLELEEKIDAAKYILKKEFTKEQLEEVISDIEDKIKKENNKNPAGNSSSGGGGTGGSYSKPSSIVIAPNIPNKEEDAKVDSVQMFTDVGEEHWAYSEIYYLNKINVVSGVGDGLFNPNGIVTREQFVKMICEAFKIEDVNESCDFSDVVSGAWYEKYIQTAVAKGIIKGIDKNRFGVGEAITREDMAIIIGRAWGENSVEDLECDFSDVESISEYAKDSVVYLNSIGVINGFDDGTFKPKDKCTRAQAAKIICTILNLNRTEG